MAQATAPFLDSTEGTDIVFADVTDFDASGDHDRIDISSYLDHGLQPTIQDHGSYATIGFSTGDNIDVMRAHAADLLLSGHFIV